MEAKILNIRPLSGECEELLFNANGSVICVKFEDKDYLQYCGIFGSGIGNKSSIAVQNDIAFVLSNGQGYIFDINKREVLHKTDNDYLEGVIFSGFNDYFVSYDFTNIYIFNTKLVWESKRVSWDGIQIDKIDGEFVYGKIFNLFELVEFKLNIKTFEYYCDWEWQEIKKGRFNLLSRIFGEK